MKSERSEVKIMLAIILFFIMAILTIGIIIKNSEIEVNIANFSAKLINTGAEQEETAISTYAEQTDHDCSKYLVTKYNKTNHWNECSICGGKYNTTPHSYEEYWTMGDSCNENNKLVHTCYCGYSYRTDNTREHEISNLSHDPGEYQHYKTCRKCNKFIFYEKCTKEDGSELSCNNFLGTCTVCNYTYTKAHHKYKNLSLVDREMRCYTCDKHIGTLSNCSTKYPTSNTFEFSYNISVSDTGSFDGANLTYFIDPEDRDYVKMEYFTKTLTSPTSIHLNGKINFEGYTKEKIIYISSYVGKFYASSNEYVEHANGKLRVSPDRTPPEINSNIVQTDLATSNGWATQKQLTISGTENYCGSLKLTMKDNDGNIYLNNANVVVKNNNWTYTFIPNIEADENGKEFILTATDNLGNVSTKTFKVYKTDKKPPTMTSATETSKQWTKTKDFTFTATEGGSGNVSISVNNSNNYVVATKTGNTYSRNYTFTEEVYGSKTITVYFKDGLGNMKSENIKIYNIDNTPPTITNNSIINKEIVLTGNDRNTTSNAEGSGIVGYRYIGSSQENVTVTETNSTQTTSNKIPLSELKKVKYVYVAAVDRAGNISQTQKITLPTYKITINPNGGTYKNQTTSTTQTGKYNGDTITIENPTKAGYNFTGWTATAGTINKTTTNSIYTFTTENATIEANWTPKTDTPYQIKHWTQKLEGKITPQDETNYTLKQTEDKTGTTDTQIEPETKNYNGFITPTKQTTIIQGNGTTTINYYYTRRTDLSYIVNYLEKDTNTIIKVPKVVRNQTFEKEMSTQNEIIEISKYNYDSIDKNKIKITTGQNEINIYYTKKDTTVKTKYINKLTGEEIENQEIITGKIDDDYQTQQKEIPGYTYIENTQNTKGTMTEQQIEVIYYYAENTSAKVQHIDQITGNILDEKTKTGVVGDLFETQAKDIENYILVEEPEKRAVQMEKEEITIKYYYVHISAGIIEKHIDQITGDILYNKTQKGNEGDPYTTQERQFQGYDLTEKPQNSTGTMKIEVTEIKYYYKKTAKIITQHIDTITGKQIAESETQTGHEQDDYETKEKEIQDYELVKEKYPKNAKGQMKVTTKEDGTYGEETKVTYYYIHRSAGVTEKHIDEITGKTIEETTQQGNEGDKYETKEKEFDEYDLTKEKYPQNSKGTMTIEETQVNYYYKRKAKIKIEYIDQITGVLLDTETIEGHEKDEYQTEEKQFQGYDLVEKPENTTGKMKIETKENGETDNQTTIKYYYKRKTKITIKHKDKETNEEIEKQETIEGHEQDEYETKAKQIKYYKQTEEPKNAKGKMQTTKNKDGTTNNETEITYYYEKQKYNLKIESWTEKITINQKEKTINKEKQNKPVKIEIPRNEIRSADIKVTYKIRITNTEELEGQIGEITYKVAKGLTFKKENNKSYWKQKGNEITANLSKQTIKPGEEKELEITLTWEKNEVNLGTKTNKVEITNTTNEAGYEETSKEDNKAETKLLITVSTGENKEKITTTIQSIATILIIIGASIIINKKK